MDDPRPNDSLVSIKQKYAVAVKKSRRIPGTFTRDYRSYFLVDIFWLAIAFLASLVFAGAQLRGRRATLWFAFHGGAEDTDFKKLDPGLIVKYLSKHTDKVGQAIQSGNGVHVMYANVYDEPADASQHIHFLAGIVDRLPSFVGRPHKATVWVSGILLFYFVTRFLVLHRRWRYNTVLLFTACALFFPINWLTPADTLLSMHITFHWLFPAFATISVVLHKVLGENAWKPATVVLELKPKPGQRIREDGDWQDTEALLDYDDLCKKEDN